MRRQQGNLVEDFFVHAICHAGIVVGDMLNQLREIDARQRMPFDVHALAFAAAMRSMMECLDKAAEMDVRVADCDAPAKREVRAQYLELGLRWRELAVRALRQDTWAYMHRFTY